MSDNKKYYYLKLKDNFYDRPEIKAIESMESGYEYISIMQKMYLRSLERDGKLMITDTIPYDLKTLGKVLGHKQETINAAVNLFEQFGLLKIMDDKSIYMTEIQSFIGHSSTEADRIRNYRERMKGVQIAYKCTPEKELDIKKEKELDIKKNKNPVSKTKPVFKKPSLNDLIEYIQAQGYSVDPEHWLDYYESNGWMVGKNKMKDWKAAVRTWQRNNYNKQSSAPKSFVDQEKESISNLFKKYKAEENEAKRITNSSN
jgi:predicted phage replisome organizer